MQVTPSHSFRNTDQTTPSPSHSWEESETLRVHTRPYGMRCSPQAPASFCACPAPVSSHTPARGGGVRWAGSGLIPKLCGFLLQQGSCPALASYCHHFKLDIKTQNGVSSRAKRLPASLLFFLLHPLSPPTLLKTQITPNPTPPSMRQSGESLASSMLPCLTHLIFLTLESIPPPPPPP